MTHLLLFLILVALASIAFSLNPDFKRTILNFIKNSFWILVTILSLLLLIVVPYYIFFSTKWAWDFIKSAFSFGIMLGYLYLITLVVVLFLNKIVKKNWIKKDGGAYSALLFFFVLLGALITVFVLFLLDWL